MEPSPSDCGWLQMESIGPFGRSRVRGLSPLLGTEEHRLRTELASASVDEWQMVGNWLDHFVDPALLACWCRKCSRGSRCVEMAQIVRRAELCRQYRAAILALTDTDVAFLSACGWPDAELRASLAKVGLGPKPPRSRDPDVIIYR